jgi:hypothetical protein
MRSCDLRLPHALATSDSSQHRGSRTDVVVERSAEIDSRLPSTIHLCISTSGVRLVCRLDLISDSVVVVSLNKDGTRSRVQAHFADIAFLCHSQSQPPREPYQARTKTDHHSSARWEDCFPGMTPMSPSRGQRMKSRSMLNCHVDGRTARTVSDAAGGR